MRNHMTESLGGHVEIYKLKVICHAIAENYAKPQCVTKMKSQKPDVGKFQQVDADKKAPDPLLPSIYI